MTTPQDNDAQKLRTLADWFDVYDEGRISYNITNGGNEVQLDLRRIAGSHASLLEEVARLQGELTSLKEDRDNWKSEAYEEQNRAARNHQLIVSLQADLERVTKERDRYREDYQNISYRTYGGTNP